MAAFYSTLRLRGLTHHAHQWASLVACGQERLVYEKALEKTAPGSRCLDWGCGNGHFSYFLSEQGYHPDSYALSDVPPLLDQKKEIMFTKGTDKSALPFPASTFDAIFALGVLEHVAEHGGDEKSSLAELARVLKPGGLLLVFHLPNRWSWIEWAKWSTWRLGLTQTREHVRRFTQGEFRSLIEERPLEIIEQGRYHLLPRATLGRLPGLGNCAAFACAVNMLDDFLALLFRPFTQNWYFILRKAT